MGAGFGFFELEAGAPGYDLPAMLNEEIQGIDQRELPWLPIDDGKVDDAERLLHRRHLVEIVQDDVGDGVALEFYDDAHAFAIRLVTQIRDALDFLVVDELGDSFDQLGLVDLIGDFGDYNRHAFGRLADA